MSLDICKPSNVTISAIPIKDLYNHLYWDHRIYDLRSKEDYIKSHICRAHNMNPSPVITVDAIADIDAQIDSEYGRAEQSSEVFIYTDAETHYENYQLQLRILNILLSYLTSARNHSNKSLKQIYTFIDGYENFHSTFPFLCSDSAYFHECSLLVWPSYVRPNLYLGSAMCRNETVIAMLNITHIMSFSEYNENEIKSTNITTLHWQLSDSRSTNLLSVFPSAIAWISKAINDENGTVLVHCDQGVSRSASVVIAYLLHSNTNLCTVEAAFNHLKLKRSVIRPNASFLQQLEEFSSTIDIKDKTIKPNKEDSTVF
ncbi:unnamed protein product [Rotaria socialis]|uniref:protein-tyrosine-phosphatase n=1 Tax=Rotaria socialis TaxID=392032 RepID=A0A819AG63_9BILA|nr:unnamed protein product [Rotaria socialis]CAF4625615.1 unnamed protein product [Rotaria socialis]